MRYLLLLLAACSTPQQRVLETELDTSLTGHVRWIHGATACVTKKDRAPWIHYSGSTPRIDTWMLLTGTRGTTPLPTDPPISGMWLIGHSLLTPAFSTPIAPGCWLLIDFFAGLPLVDRNPAEVLPENGWIGAWRDGTTAFLIIKPNPDLIGRTFYVQLLIDAPGENLADRLISHGVEIVVGS